MMSEKNPSPTSETILNNPEGLPPRDEAIAMVKDEISSLRQELKAAEAVVKTPGFRATAEDMISARAHLRHLRDEGEPRLNGLEEMWHTYGGEEIDAAQQKVDELNFASDALDHRAAKAALSDAKDAFYSNLQAEREDEKYGVLTPSENDPSSVVEPQNPENNSSVNEADDSDNKDTHETEQTPSEERKKDFGADVLALIARMDAQDEQIAEQEKLLEEQAREGRRRQQELEDLRAEHEVTAEAAQQANIDNALLREGLDEAHSRIAQLEQNQSPPAAAPAEAEEPKTGWLKKASQWSDAWFATKWPQHNAKIKKGTLAVVTPIADAGEYVGRKWRGLTTPIKRGARRLRDKLRRSRTR